MKVKELIEQLNFLIKDKFLEEDDEVITMVNTGQGWNPAMLKGVNMPKLILGVSFEEFDKTQVEICFTDKDLYFKFPPIFNPISKGIIKQ